MSNHSSLDASAELFVRDASGDYSAASGDEVLHRARRVLSHRVRRGTAFNSPQVSRDYLSLRLGTRDHEVFVVVMLDTQHRLIEVLELFRGTIDAASVYPREVVKEALMRNAAAVIFAHNHPSGLPEPSAAELAAPDRGGSDGRVVVSTRDSAQETINEVGQEITRRNLSVQPTLTIRPGFPMRVMVSKDLVLRPYQPLFFERSAR